MLQEMTFLSNFSIRFSEYGYQKAEQGYLLTTQDNPLQSPVGALNSSGPKAATSHLLSGVSW